MRLFITGPPPGHYLYNATDYTTSELALKSLGHDVVLPVGWDGASYTSYREYFRGCLGSIVECDGLVLIGGWRKAEGCVVLRKVALQLSMKVLPIEKWLGESAPGRST